MYIKRVILNRTFKKIIYITGFVGIFAGSLLSLEKSAFQKRVLNHSNNECIHDSNIISHRGFSSIELENSSKAIEKGFECNCSDGVEIDVRLTKDNEIILAHDSYIEGVGKVSNKSLDELINKKYGSSSISKLKIFRQCLLLEDGKLIYDRYCDIIDNQEKIITLKQVIKNNDNHKELLVDIKFNKNDNEIFMEKLNEIFKNYNGNLNIVFQANDYENLKLMKEKYPNYKYQLIIRKRKELKYLDSEFNMFGIRKNLISKELVEEEINKGNFISVWTINSCSEFNDLSSKLGESINDVTIITDYPDEMCYLFSKNKVKKLK